MQTVLVVEDEPNLRASIVRGLSRVLCATVIGAGSVAEARKAVEEQPPSVVVSDIDLPDGTGLEVIADLDARGLRVPIVLVSSYVRHYASRVPTRPGIDTYEKPVPLETLRRVVEEALTRSVPAPDSSPFLAADYLQLAGIGRKSVVIEVRAASGDGTIVVRGGAVVAADDAAGSGMDAFRRLAFAAGTVTCRALRPGEATETNLTGGCEELLMEAARQHDEATATGADEADASGWTLPPPRFASAAPGPRSSAPPPSDDDAAFQRAYEAGVEALLERRYTDALSFLSLARALRPDDARVNANLTRLSSLVETKRETA